MKYFWKFFFSSCVYALFWLPHAYVSMYILHTHTQNIYRATICSVMSCLRAGTPELHAPLSARPLFTFVCLSLPLSLSHTHTHSPVERLQCVCSDQSDVRAGRKAELLPTLAAFPSIPLFLSESRGALFSTAAAWVVLCCVFTRWGHTVVTRAWRHMPAPQTAALSKGQRLHRAAALTRWPAALKQNKLELFWVVKNCKEILWNIFSHEKWFEYTL